MSRIVLVQIFDTETGSSAQRKFVIKNRGALIARIQQWLSATAEPALDQATQPTDQEVV